MAFPDDAAAVRGASKMVFKAKDKRSKEWKV
jgi:hypothetical protein